MLRSFLPLALALFVVADAHAQRSTHTIAITYDRAERGLSEARITVAPREDGARAPWRGEITELAVLSKKGIWVQITDMERARGTTSAKAVLPPAADLAAVLVRGEGGSWLGWNIEQGSAIYTEVEWTLLAQDGEEAEEPEVECDFSGCPTTAIRDPYTCECIEDIKDPWEGEATTEGVLIGI